MGVGGFFVCAVRFAELDLALELVPESGSNGPPYLGWLTLIQIESDTIRQFKASHHTQNLSHSASCTVGVWLGRN